LAVIQRNMTEYGDQYAVAVNFLIRRGFAREQTVHGGPRAGAAHARTGGGAGAPPQQRRRVPSAR